MERVPERSVIISNLLWKLLERLGSQGVQLVVQIVLARILLPAEYGLIAITAIFLSIASIFVQSGLNTALIQKKGADDLDFSTVFFVSLLIAAGAYALLFFTAPAIAAFFDQPLLVSVLRILSLTLFLGAVLSVQNAVIARTMRFRKLFSSSLMAIMISGAIGIAMAYAGFGVWALVGQQAANQLLLTVMLTISLKWCPMAAFSPDRLKTLFSFGWKLLVSALLDAFHHNLRSLVIGLRFEPAALGYYDMGARIPGLIVTNINGSMLAITLPVLSASQDDPDHVRVMAKRAIITSSFVVFPMMAGLVAVAEPLVQALLTDKWLPAVPFLQLFCVSYALWPFHTVNLQAMNALGRSDLFLKLEVIKLLISLAVLAVTIPLGIYAIAAGGTLGGIASTYINAYPNGKLIGYRYSEQMRDILPNLSLAAVMGVIVWCIRFAGMGCWPTLALQIFIGAVLYIGLARMLRMESYVYLIGAIRDLTGGKGK